MLPVFSAGPVADQASLNLLLRPQAVHDAGEF